MTSIEMHANHLCQYLHGLPLEQARDVALKAYDVVNSQWHAHRAPLAPAAAVAAREAIESVYAPVRDCSFVYNPQDVQDTPVVRRAGGA